MKTDDVKKLSPLARLAYWVRERESIRIAKEAGDRKPWTDDERLQSYRFTNVRRMDDKVSQWLLHNWYKPHRNWPYLLPIVAFARFVNNPSSLTLVQEHLFASGGPEWEQTKRILRAAKDRGETIFNGAYMVRGNTTKSPDKIGTVVDEYIGALASACVVVDRTSMRTTHERIAEPYGFGSFMAGQVVADLRWAVTGSWADKHVWAPAGPGSMRGLNRLLGRPPKAPLNQNEFLGLFQQHVLGSLAPLLPVDLSARLEAMDYQNCLCEYDKYERALWGEGKPKATYEGR
jgi:hypothetical protein